MGSVTPLQGESEDVTEDGRLSTGRAAYDDRLQPVASKPSPRVWSPPVYLRKAN